VLAARGLLPAGRRLIHDSIVGSRFDCRVAGHVTVDGRAAVHPVVTGMAYRFGASEFTVDPRDALVPGFVLR
jgi:proline racemase